MKKGKNKKIFFPAVLTAAILCIWALAAEKNSDGPAKSDDRQSVVSGPFQASWEALFQYDCPEWFRDAKFGIWAHWTA